MKNEVDKNILDKLKQKIQERKTKEYNEDFDNHIYHLFFDFLQSQRSENNRCIICNNEIVNTITLDNEVIDEIYYFLDDSGEYTGQNKDLHDLFIQIYDLFEDAWREFWKDGDVLEGKTTFNFKRHKYDVEITDEDYLYQCKKEDAIEAWIDRKREEQEEEEEAKEYT